METSNSMAKYTLTQAFVEKATCQADKKKIDYCDTKTTGLLLKVFPSGKKVFYLRCYNLRKKLMEIKLAPANVLKLSQVRELALQHLAEIAMGRDPFEAKKGLKNVPIFAVFVAEFYLPHIKTYKRSVETDQSLLKNHLLPALGKMHLDEILRGDMVKLFAKHRETHMPGSTNRIIILSRYIFNLALKWETPGVTRNPTAGIPLLPENNKKERFLTEEEAKRLFAVLEESEAPMLKYIVAMLLFTGARKNELLQSKWSDFNLEKQQWTIEFNKSGKPRYVPLSEAALQVLRSLPRIKGCLYPFANPDTQKPFVQIYYAWDTARKKAGMPDLRIHDLRHSFASFLVNNGESLYCVQKLLGHTQIKTTQRYSHLSQDSLLGAANVIPIGMMAKTSMMMLPEAAVEELLTLTAKAG